MTSTIKALAASGKLAQLAASGKKGFPTGEGYVAEPKWDGWRIIAEVTESGVNFYARSGNLHNGALPKVEAELLAHFPAGTWLDGEAVALRIEDGQVISEWSIAQSVLTKIGAHAAADKITYMVFDLIAHGGIDARPLSFGDRRNLLLDIFEGEDFEAIQLSPQRDATADAHAAFVATGFEGTVMKALNKPYGAGKREGGGWTKVKPSITIEGVIMGFKPGENGFKGMVGAIIFGQHDADGKLIERGRCSGMDMRTRRHMTDHWDQWDGKVIEVGLVAPLGGAGNPPQFRRLRADRDAESVGIHND